MKPSPLLLAPLVAAFALAGCGAPKPSSPAKDLVAAAQEYARVSNTHDVPATLALYSETAQWQYPLMDGYVAEKASFARALELDAALGTQTVIEDCVAEGLRVTCTFIEKNDWMTMHGVAEWRSPGTVFTFDEAGLIQSLSFGPKDEEAWSKLKPVWVAFDRWARENRAEEHARMVVPGERRIRWEREAGLLMMSLGKEWVDEGRPYLEETVARMEEVEGKEAAPQTDDSPSN